MTKRPGLYRRFYDVIRHIPRGKVATYGQVAHLAGLPAYARHVGYALAALQGDHIPWHRVVNANGEISLRAVPHLAMAQRIRLEKEGLVFGKHDRLVMERDQWSPLTDVKYITTNRISRRASNEFPSGNRIALAAGGRRPTP